MVDVVHASPIPIVTAGGGVVTETEKLLDGITDAMASGVAVGRNIFGAADPGHTARSSRSACTLPLPRRTSCRRDVRWAAKQHVPDPQAIGNELRGNMKSVYIDLRDCTGELANAAIEESAPPWWSRCRGSLSRSFPPRMRA
ncbi:hypothetical protein [Streptomyces yunnanensis]|uniref:hypothetical protein n=1 Tax=Streptomyces yunnanensis TaxID=156453 RepID=UPI003B83180A